MKLKIYVHAKAFEFGNRVVYHVSDIDMSEYYGPVVFEGEVDIPFEPVTPADLIPGQVAILRKEQQKVRAEAEVRANAVEEQISKLLAIEWEGR